jgi:hypothetical protein
MAANGKDERYLERLTQAFLSLDAERHVNTKEFADAVEAIMPIFDYLGECNVNTFNGRMPCWRFRAGHIPSHTSY